MIEPTSNQIIMEPTSNQSAPVAPAGKSSRSIFWGGFLKIFKSILLVVLIPFIGFCMFVLAGACFSPDTFECMILVPVFFVVAPLLVISAILVIIRIWNESFSKFWNTAFRILCIIAFIVLATALATDFVRYYF